MKRVRQVIIAVITSWWFLGALGWGIVAWHYPVDSSLPTYAG
jgi:hypothetical protein